VKSVQAGTANILTGSDLEEALAQVGVTRETLVDRGLEFTRRAHDGGRYYFILNSGGRDLDGWVTLDDRSRAAVAFDPMTGLRGDLAVRATSAGTLDVRLRLSAGQSLVVATAARAVGEPFRAFEPAGPPNEVRGPWTIKFIKGGPTLPPPRAIDRLGSWTELGEDAIRQFSGTAVYETTIPRPASPAAAWQIDLGNVHDSARVRLNGRDLGTLIGAPFRVTVDAAQLSDRNTLEVSVTNLMANRIAALDRAGVRWKKFYNVNFPARLPPNRGADGLFSAAAWAPLASGLVGPVTITAGENKAF
jgi:hypothetical protein